MKILLVLVVIGMLICSMKAADLVGSVTNTVGKITSANQCKGASDVLDFILDSDSKILKLDTKFMKAFFGIIGKKEAAKLYSYTALIATKRALDFK